MTVKMESDEDYDQLYEEDEDFDPNEFSLGACLGAPSAQLYTTKQLHSTCNRNRRAIGDGGGHL